MIVDRSQKEFNCLGPMSDDTSLTNAVSEAQNEGRNVNCFSIPLENRQGAVQEYLDMGYVHTQEPLVANL